MPEQQNFYREHCWTDAPLFHQPWWLDAVVAHHWDVCVLQERNEMKAYFLYAWKKDWTGFQIIMPQLTQFLGPNYRLNESTQRKRLNEETETLDALLKQLPPSEFFESRWHFRFQNWLPFHWKGFSQTTRYTYLIEDISNPELLRENFSEKIQREISKAENQFTIAEPTDASIFFQLLKKNFSGKNMDVPFGKELLEKIFKACREHDAGKIFLARDASGKIAAGIFIVWDSSTAYYLIGGKDDDFGNSGAMSFLFWNAFWKLSSTIRSFDFEGSMIRGVENYFRSFGAEQKGFFQITKINSPLLQIKSGIRSALKRK